MDLLADPLALLLLPLPILALRLLPPRPAEAGALAVPPAVAARLTLGEGLTERRRRLRLVLAGLAWALLVVALAGPQRILPANVMPATARDLILVLDLSGSMEQRDFLLEGRTVRRIDAVKAVAGDFLSGRAGDRVGLVFFADQTEMAAVPTYDLAAVSEVLKEARIGLLGRSTAIGDGLGLAVKRLKDSPSPARIVVLLSDGTNTAGKVGPQSAAELARSFGITVHTIALGRDEELEGSGGAASLVDVETLRAIAEISGGRSFRVTSTDDLAAVAAAIDALEGGRSTAPTTAVAEPLWPWPAGLALALLTGLGLAERRRR